MLSILLPVQPGLPTWPSLMVMCISPSKTDYFLGGTNWIYYNSYLLSSTHLLNIVVVLSQKTSTYQSTSSLDINNIPDYYLLPYEFQLTYSLSLIVVRNSYRDWFNYIQLHRLLHTIFQVVSDIKHNIQCNVSVSSLAYDPHKEVTLTKYLIQNGHTKTLFLFFDILS